MKYSGHRKLLCELSKLSKGDGGVGNRKKVLGKKSGKKSFY